MPAPGLPGRAGQHPVRPVMDPPHSLVEQAWAPRWQRHGTMNVDGFGVGWYADGDPVPARYRRAGADLVRRRPSRPGAGDPHARDAVRGPLGLRRHGHGRSGGRSLRRRPMAFQPQRSARGWSAAAGGRPCRAAVTASARAEAAGESITDGSAAASSRSAAAVLRLAERLPAADLLSLQARCDTALHLGAGAAQAAGRRPARRRTGRHRRRHLAPQAAPAGSTCC